jgi:hypothetical protein
MAVTVNGEEYLTAGESARFLKVSPATFLDFQKKYALKYLTQPGSGNRKFFKKKDLEPIREFRPGTPE